MAKRVLISEPEAEMGETAMPVIRPPEKTLAPEPIEAEWLVGIRKVPGGYVAVMHRQGVTTVVSPSPGRLEHAAMEVRRACGRLVGGT